MRLCFIVYNKINWKIYFNVKDKNISVHSFLIKLFILDSFVLLFNPLLFSLLAGNFVFERIKNNNEIILRPIEMMISFVN